MNNRIDAVYARQSVDKQDSISIESQIEFCKYELKGANFKEYTDKGFSGKNTDRPKFRELVQDIEQGLVKRVIVYKLDRISRSIIDFAGMMELFQHYNVEFVSSTEKFDTSTPMGRAMLNICIVFAQLERETIQKRVTDAFYSRCQKGFYMGGKIPYGFKPESTVIDGVRTKMLVADSNSAERLKLMFEMYAEPGTSLGDIVRCFIQEGLDFNGGELNRPALSVIMRNPVYAQADLSIYEYFKNQGAVLANDAADFTGLNGCYLYKGREAAGSKSGLKDKIIVIAPHEWLVDSDTWLKCQRKLASNIDFCGISKKAKNTWLSGKIKCGHCGMGLLGARNPLHVYYFRCRKRADRKTCVGCGNLKVAAVEASMYAEMCRKMVEFQTLTGGSLMKANPKLTALNVELAKVEAEIEKLIDTLTGANATLLSYANTKIEEFDTKRQSLMKAIADMSSESVSLKQIEQISGHLDNWDNVSFDDKRMTVDVLIANIKATGENVDIAWKF